MEPEDAFGHQTGATRRILATLRRLARAETYPNDDGISASDPNTSKLLGSFPNIDEHMRSLVNGQQSLVCPAGFHLIKFQSKFVSGSITTPGGIHCVADTTSLPVWCCRDKS